MFSNLSVSHHLIFFPVTCWVEFPAINFSYSPHPLAEWPLAAHTHGFLIFFWHIITTTSRRPKVTKASVKSNVILKPTSVQKKYGKQKGITSIVSKVLSN